MIHGAMQPYSLTLDKFLDHAAKWHPDAKVVTARENGPATGVGYADLRRRAGRISTVLAGLGIELGDHVATLAWNTQAHVEAWYAIMGMGAVCHTLNPRLTAAQIASMLAQSKARVLIISADLHALASQIAERATAIQHVLVIDGSTQGWRLGGASPGVTALEAEIEAATGEAEWGQFDENSPSGLCFTSGTTGAPKGVSYTHRSSFLHTLRLLQADVLALRASDAVMPVVPMFHASAWGLPFAVPAVGAKLVLPGRQADGASLAKLIAAEGVTIAVGVPTVWVGLIDHLEKTGGELPSLERIIVGGAPMPPALMARIEERLGVTIQTSWGMTELSPSGTFAPPADPDRKASVSGRPAIGVDLLLADASGQPLAEQRGAEGYLKVRGAAVVERYFGFDEASTDEDGWFDTGDLARIDARGNLTITGRAKDLIKSGGEWINPSEIEAVIGALPQVSLAAVIGRADPKWGERPVLLVELREPEAVTDDELLKPLQGRVAPWWIPDAVVRLSKMPLASTGKIDKMRLREIYGGI
ncbi:AMP-binding protein [Pseudokordiimonas caeni]|uniref:AMP-binding protein n=1 Tax=Pseudokordiimonas caeni TaxID=2997908 RepID=UPI002811CB53|nr:AMP-binding protein [Pseudokordiimonas caeni]